jgi:hypothetical protein
MNNTNSKNSIFVVLGTARSGTSTISRALKALGIDLGNHLTRASDTVNPKGFWEDNEIVYKINRELFNQLDYQSNGVVLIDKQAFFSEKLHLLKQAAIKLINQRFNQTTSWGFKDPQTARLLPFWQSVFSSLNLQEHYIIALRNPLSSAQSNRNLAGTEIETGLLLWLMHLVPAVEETIGKKRVIVSYELLMENPRAELERLQTKLQLPASQQDGINQYINEFLDRNLYRNKFSYEDFKSHSAVKLFPLCLKTYDLLLRVAKDELCFDDAEFIASWQTIRNTLENEHRLYCYIDAILKKQHHTERTLRTIQKSTLWKLIYPLRKINEGIRAFKHARKKHPIVT